VQTREDFDEERQLTVMVIKRVGPIGFSPVAEANYNFGVTGVPLVMGVIGLVVGFLGMWGRSLLGRGLMLATLIPLLIFVRNSFTPVPGQLVIGWSMVVVLWGVATVVAIRLQARGPQEPAVAPPLPADAPERH
jgi:hypothetical protein